MISLKSIAVAATVFLGGVACSGTEPSPSFSANPSGSADGMGSPSDEHAVIVEGFLFKPADIEVPSGTEVVWSNRDEILHTVTAGTPDAPEPTFDGQLNDRGATFRFSFDEAGDYPYFCSRHQHMQGTVTVA